LSEESNKIQKKIFWPSSHATWWSQQ